MNLNGIDQEVMELCMGGTPIEAGGSYPPLFYTMGVKGVHKFMTTNQ